MYVIKVIVPITSWNTDWGYFTSCYRSHTNEGYCTWIGYDRIEEKLWKKFKSYKSAENKIKFLKEKVDLNGYMCDWKFEIEEIKNG